MFSSVLSAMAETSATELTAWRRNY